MITPQDIQEKEFSKSVRGYREDDVNEFLDMVTVDFEKLIYENAKLQEELARARQEIDELKGDQGSVAKVMEQAQNMMEELSASAEKRAEIILKNAESSAEMAVKDAMAEATRLKEENKNLKNSYVNFRNRYRKILEDELDRFNAVTGNIFPDYDDNQLETLLQDENMDRTVTVNSEQAKSDMVKEINKHIGEDRKTMIISSEDIPR